MSDGAVDAAEGLCASVPVSLHNPFMFTGRVRLKPAGGAMGSALFLVILLVVLLAAHHSKLTRVAGEFNSDSGGAGSSENTAQGLTVSGFGVSWSECLMRA